MLHKLLVTLTILALLLAGCASSEPIVPPSEQPASPLPSDYPGPNTFTPVPTVSYAYPGPDTAQAVPVVPSDYPAPEAPVWSGSELAPQPGDDKLTRSTLFPDLEGSALVILESFPIQVNANLRGSLPDPCHELRAIVTVDESQKRVDIELYSLVDPNMACITVIKPYEASLPLGSFSGGSYSVYVNGELLGTFDS